MSASINLMAFQRHAINKLLEFMEGKKRDAILKSPTGSGKTIILTHFMDEYLKEHSRTVFVWLTPGKGSLEEQSKKKMDIYIHNAKTKLLKDIMTSGFEDGDCCFINWEKLTKKGVVALKDSERTNFLEWTHQALDKGLRFKVIIDESHQNFTEKADAIVQYFKTDKIVRSSATPLSDKNAVFIEIKELAVIDEGLIKKMIVINENFPMKVDLKDKTEYDFLLEEGLKKHSQLSSLFLNKGSKINPLIVVQLPNNSDALIEQVEHSLEKKGLSCQDKTLAIWLSDRHENCEGIEKNDAAPIAVIIKQAIATGWDCPRAHILVKLRENMDETFEIQTIGRIRRMPEAKHYGDDVLDSCYIYTLDEKFAQGVRDTMGKNALDAKTLFLKDEYKGFSLIKEQRTMVSNPRDPRKAFDAIKRHFEKTFGLQTGGGEETYAENQKRLESGGFIFSDKVVRVTISGETTTLEKLEKEDIDKYREITYESQLGTHASGRLMHHSVGEIGKKISMPYDDMRTILFRLFCEKDAYKDRFLSLKAPLMYIFAINNEELLREHCDKAMFEETDKTQMLSSFESVSEREYRIPQSTLFTYDGSSKVQTVSKKNAYREYLLSAKPRSLTEREFEKFCEKCDEVDMFCKNGDKGEQYFSIVYSDNSGAQKLFYPDYILLIKGAKWIIETKGAFGEAGQDEDIDRFSEKKFNALKAYLEKHECKGGFVRYDKDSSSLLIATEKYSDDVASADWKLLEDVIQGFERE